MDNTKPVVAKAGSNTLLPGTAHYDDDGELTHIDLGEQGERTLVKLLRDVQSLPPAGSPADTRRDSRSADDQAYMRNAAAAKRARRAAKRAAAHG